MAHNQHQFQVDHETVSSIAWGSLKVALRRIHGPTLCTKVCNDLFPTNRILYWWEHQGHDSCPSANLRKQLITWYYVVTRPDWNYGKNTFAYSKTGCTNLVCQPKWKTHCAVQSLMGLTTNLLTHLNTLLSTPQRSKARMQLDGIIYSWFISLLNGQPRMDHSKPHQEHCARYTCGKPL